MDDKDNRYPNDELEMRAAKHALSVFVRGINTFLYFILAVYIFWALIFGINIDGKHYELDCDCSGVDVEGLGQ